MKTPAKSVVAILLAAAVAVPFIAQWEGTEFTGYEDIAGVATACVGSTKNVIVGKLYTEQECLERLATDTVEHAVKIDHCIKVPVKPEMHAAFISHAFNFGVNAFCTSTMVRKLNAGDYAGACASLDDWVMVKKNGVKLSCRDPANKCMGIVYRRAAEREMCERGVPQG